MTDKENRTLKNGVIAIFDKFNILDHTATIGGLRDDILRYIDSLQEEPVSIWHSGYRIPESETNILMIRKDEKDFNYPPIAGCFHGTNFRLDGKNWGYYNGFCYNEIEPPVRWAYIDDLLNEKIKEEPVSNPIDFEQELYKAFGQVKDFTLGMRIAKWFYDMGKNSQDPVSEDLEKVADQYSQGIESDYTNDMFDRGDIYEAVIYGAQWQKQQMMAKAVNVEVHIDAGGYPYIPELELYDYDKDVPLAKEGDKYKVVLIKEE